MGIERARVVEVHSQTSATGVCAGYLIADRLVLTAGGVAGRQGAADVRPASTAVWCSASQVWAAASGDVAILEIDDPSAVPAPPRALRWGRVSGRGPVAVAALGFPPASGKPEWFRDAEQFFGHVRPLGDSDADGSLEVKASATSRVTGEGLNGAALFAGADLVGVLIAGTELRARPVSALAADPSFVEWVGDAGGLHLTQVSSPAFGLPIL